MKKEWVNELDNPITVEVKRVQDPDLDRIKIRVEGPTSKATWLLTYSEAEEIHRQVGKFLEKYGTWSPKPEN